MAKLKKRKDGRYQRKITLSTGKVRIVYGKTLAELSSLCADGSTLMFDYPDENFFDAREKRVQNTIMMAKAGGEPMQSAFPMESLKSCFRNTAS